MASSLSRLPLDLSVEWQPTTYTTDPPRYIPYTVWSLGVSLVAPSPVHVAVLVVDDGEARWGLQPDDAARVVEVRARFAPHDWRTSDAMEVAFGLQRTTVTDARLKSDAREVVKVTSPKTAVTGEPIEVAELPDHSIRLVLLAVAQEDTDRQRMDRWRIKPRFNDGLPESLDALTSGKQTGTTRL